MKIFLVVILTLIVSGCAATRSSSNVSLPDTSPAETSSPTIVTDIFLTQDDILDRNYESLGDIEVSVSKTTVFHPDPTNEMIDEKLREEAAELGADAVILVRYGTVGISAFSWGKLDGNGRAIKFVD